MCQRDGMDPIWLGNLIQPAKIVINAEKYTTLYGGDTRLRGLQFPDTFCFCKEAVCQSMRIPILGSVREMWVADLRTY